jgi:hypothetical protein
MNPTGWLKGCQNNCLSLIALLFGTLEIVLVLVLVVVVVVLVVVLVRFQDRVAAGLDRWAHPETKRTKIAPKGQESIAQALPWETRSLPVGISLRRTISRAKY